MTRLTVHLQLFLIQSCKVNARLALEADNWSPSLIRKNLTDEDILSFVTDTPLSATLGSPSYTGYMERQRTIAVQALYRF